MSPEVGRKNSRRVSGVAKFKSAIETIEDEHSRWQKKGVPAEHLPFVMHHDKKTKGAIVLIHGISETPTGMTFLADQYYQQGFNVITVLLEGHGTSPEALNRGTMASWRDQIDHAMKQAGLLGDNVFVGGYSFGGTLAYDAGSRLGNSIAGVALHSPMLEASPHVSEKVRERAREGQKWTSEKADESTPGISGFTYQRTPTTAYVAMLDTMNELKSTWTTSPISPQVYVVYGEADTIAAPSATQSFLAAQAVPPSHVLTIPGGGHDDAVRVTKRKKFPTDRMGNFIHQMLAQ